jgi:phosphoglycerol transferase MdoB-like AlkP superfamily enzyme
LRDKDVRDIIGGLGLSAVGLFAVLYGQRYDFGDLNRMGPGYFPVVLGLLLAGLGVLIALPAFFRRGEGVTVAWKTFGLVMASLVVFAFTLKLLGLVLASALAVLVASLADNAPGWKWRLATATGIALVTWVVFKLGLSMVLPSWPWSP